MTSTSPGLPARGAATTDGARSCGPWSNGGWNARSVRDAKPGVTPVDEFRQASQTRRHRCSWPAWLEQQQLTDTQQTDLAAALSAPVATVTHVAVRKVLVESWDLSGVPSINVIGAHRRLDCSCEQV